jgi:hypothetical protein
MCVCVCVCILKREYEGKKVLKQIRPESVLYNKNKNFKILKIILNTFLKKYILKKYL